MNQNFLRPEGCHRGEPTLSQLYMNTKGTDHSRVSIKDYIRDADVVLKAIL